MVSIQYKLTRYSQYTITSTEQFYSLIKSGEITEDTILYDAEKDQEVKAGDMYLFRNYFQTVTPAAAVEHVIDAPPAEQTSQTDRPKNKPGQVVYTFSIAFMLIGCYTFYAQLSYLYKFALTFDKSIKFSEHIDKGIMLGFICALLIWAVLWALTLNKRIRVMLVIYSSLFMIGTFIILLSALGTVQANNEKFAAAQIKLLEIERDACSDQLQNNASVSASDYAPYTDMVLLCQTYRNDIKTENDHLIHAFEDSALDKTLSIDTLKSTEKIKAERAKLQKLQEEISGYRERMNKIQSRFIASFEKLRIPLDFKNKYLARAKANYDRDSTLYFEFKINEINILQQTDKILCFIENQKGNYVIKDNTLYFHSISDLSNYYGMSNMLEAYIDLQADLQMKVRKNNLEFLKECNKLIEKSKSKN